MAPDGETDPYEVYNTSEKVYWESSLSDHARVSQSISLCSLWPRSIAIIGEEEIKENSEIISHKLTWGNGEIVSFLVACPFLTRKSIFGNWKIKELTFKKCSTWRGSLIQHLTNIYCTQILYRHTDKDTLCPLLPAPSCPIQNKSKSISLCSNVCASFNNKQWSLLYLKMNI